MLMGQNFDPVWSKRPPGLDISSGRLREVGLQLGKTLWRTNKFATVVFSEREDFQPNHLQVHTFFKNLT